MRSPVSLRRALAITVATAALALTVAHPAAAVTPATAPAVTAGVTAAADACTVTQAQLAWGFKESFRSYISGSIAHGEWQTQDGATYATPAFGWATATGTIAPDASSAAVGFAGGIHFTGHDGLLDTTVANPTLVLDSRTHAVLLLDVSGVSMEAAMAGDTTVETVAQVPFVDIDLSGATVTTDEASGAVSITASDAPTTITAEGFEAFGNYETGTAFDPISLQITASCPVATPTPTADATPQPDATTTLTSDETDADDLGATSVGVVVGLITGVVAVAAIVAAVVWARRRRTPGTAPDDAPEPGTGSDPGERP